jgi:lipoprotein-releasing system ATP-binding protein
MNNGSPLIRVVDLHKSFATNGNQVRVLQSVNLEIQRGDMVAVVGASGVGKSTLLHVLGTLERPDRGDVFYGDTNVFGFDDEKLASFRNEAIGFVFQFHHLLPEFNAVENTMMPALIKGMNAREACGRAEAILERVGLKDRFRHRIGELSGGEQQRVAVARSLVLEPAVLLADEPTGNLDTKTGETIHELMLSLNRDDGVTAVIVTHNMGLAERLSRRVTLIEGRAVLLD